MPSLPPGAAPGTPAWKGTSVTVSRALRLIEEGALQQENLAELSGRPGVSARHLHRLFLSHLGTSPIAVAKTWRLNFAKQLSVPVAALRKVIKHAIEHPPKR